MREQTAAPTAPGVIDSLSDGFRLVNRFLWVMLFPIGLDVLLWLAPRIVAMPVVERFLILYNQALASYGDDLVASGGFDSQTVETFFRSLGETNILTNLAWNPAGAAVPSFVAGLTTAAGAVLSIDSLSSLVTVFLVLQCVGLYLGCLYFGLLGQLVRDGRPSLVRLVARSWRYWLTFLGFVGLVVGISLGISVVLGLLALVSVSVALLASAALTSALFFVMLLLLIYLYFFVDAVVVGEFGVLAALRSSFRIVRVSFWSSLALIVLVFLIGQGMAVIWSQVAVQSWGVAFAVVGNSYVASGLAAASMLFYRSRMGRITATSSSPVNPPSER